MFSNLNILFLTLMIFSTILSISSPSWLAAWMGLEINMISFISLIISNKNILSSESALKYFLIQAMASSSLISFCLLNSFSFYTNFEFYTPLIINAFIILPLLMKLGASPFHFWFVSVMEGLSWPKCFLLMTWQKITPLFMMFYFTSTNLILFFFIYLSLFIGALGGLNQTSFKKLISYSSINHLGWMLTSLIFSKKILLMYFSMYSILNLLMILFLDLYKLYSFNQINNKNQDTLFCFTLIFSLLSLGGLPPLLGFFPKWILFQILIINGNIILSLIMVCLALIVLFFYLRLVFNYMMLFHPMMKWHLTKFVLNQNTAVKSVLLMVSSSGLFLFNLIY